MSKLFLCTLALLAGAESGPVMGIDGVRFTVDGTPTFLLGCSYYGALAIEDPKIVAGDLEQMRSYGFNWVRVWATWRYDDDDCSAVTPDGVARPEYMRRLKALLALAAAHGMLVDVTVSRGAPPFPSTQKQHLAAIRTLAEELKGCPNAYFDVANERDVRDARYVSKEETAELVHAVKQIDPARLCTASCTPDPADAPTLITTATLDFIAPHLSRTPESPAQTEGYCLAVAKALKSSGHTVPVLLQEPFRRGYAEWEPKSDDFMTDLAGAAQGGAAGWCFHNGASHKTDDGRPRRSFDLRPNEGRLFQQFDNEEQKFLGQLRDVSFANRSVRR